MNVIIDIKSIHFKYPDTINKQLNGVTLKINEFEITTLTGKVGSGKSSILKHIIGINKPDKGKVLVDGKNISEDSNVFHKEIGFLFENPEDQIFYPNVAEDISFGPRNLGLRKAEIALRVINACEEVGILHLLDRDTITLSLGEKTLVALAGILAMKPKILLLDSPGLGLDLWTKPKILNLLKELKNNHTIVIASNDKDFLRISDKIFLIHEGKVKGSYKNYKNFRSGLDRRKDTLKKSKDEK